MAGLVSLTACSAGLGLGSGGGAGQGQPPSSIVVIFKVGVPPRQARSEVRSCHPFDIYGSDTARHHGQSETSIFIWGPPTGTSKATALYDCIKAVPDVASQNWAG
jgi:hypothetical protein